VIETWFDDKFKEYFYTREPLARYLDMGDISEQLAMKERLKCKSFEWFMDNVAYDVYDKFPPLPPNLHWGEVSLNVLKTARKLTNHRVNFFFTNFYFSTL
jgi:polypeptide N-acetylgalactosaminyltransferase